MSCKNHFNDVIYSNTEAYHGEKHLRLWNKSVILHFTNESPFVTIGDNDIYLEEITALIEGKKYGSKAMQWITKIADEEKINIFLHAASPDSSCPELRQRLLKFYFHFDFEVVRGNILKRSFKSIPALQN